MCFGGGRGSDASRYIATVSGNHFDSPVYLFPLTCCPDDKMLMVWDLLPSVDMATMLASPTVQGGTASPPPRTQPTAYVIAFPHPLTSINSHPSTSKEFLVSDCRGSLFLTDWRSDPDDPDQDSWHNSSLVELVEPHALSEASLGRSLQWSGSVAWQRDSANMYRIFPHLLCRGLIRFLVWEPSTGPNFPYGISPSFKVANPSPLEIASRKAGISSGTLHNSLISLE